MNLNNGLVLVPPRVTPVLDPWFRPAVLSNVAFRRKCLASGKSVPVRLALEQADGAVVTFSTDIFPAGHHQAAPNFAYIERLGLPKETTDKILHHNAQKLFGFEH